MARIAGLHVFADIRSSPRSHNNHPPWQASYKPHCSHWRPWKVHSFIFILDTLGAGTQDHSIGCFFSEEKIHAGLQIVCWYNASAIFQWDGILLLNLTQQMFNWVCERESWLFTCNGAILASVAKNISEGEDKMVWTDVWQNRCTQSTSIEASQNKAVQGRFSWRIRHVCGVGRKLSQD